MASYYSPLLPSPQQHQLYTNQPTNSPVLQHHNFLTPITQPRIYPFAQLAQFLQSYGRDTRFQVEQSVVLLDHRHTRCCCPDPEEYEGGGEEKLIIYHCVHATQNINMARLQLVDGTTFCDTLLRIDTTTCCSKLRTFPCFCSSMTINSFSWSSTADIVVPPPLTSGLCWLWARDSRRLAGSTEANIRSVT